MIAVVAGLSYWTRFAEGSDALRSDVFFRYSTAIGTFVLDGMLLLLMLLIARGLPLRDSFALRTPPSWARSAQIGAAALIASWTTSLVIELFVGHAVREQAVPQFFDQTRLAAFALNALAIAVFVPVVEESACRGIGFFLMEPYGARVAVVGSAIAFALAHGAVLDLPWVLVTGLGLGYLRWRSNSLIPCVLLHATVNGVAIAASALSAIPA